MWSGTSSSSSRSPRSDRRNPSVCRSGRWKTRRSVSAASMAVSENLRCPPRAPDGFGRQASMAADEIQIVRSPRSTRPRSYSGQLPTRYLVLNVGCTLERLLDMRRPPQRRLYDGVVFGRVSIRAPTPSRSGCLSCSLCEHAITDRHADARDDLARRFDQRPIVSRAHAPYESSRALSSSEKTCFAAASPPTASAAA